MDYTGMLEVAVSLSNRFDTHWTLFITVHLALIGGIIYVERPLNRVEKGGAILIYTGFAGMNGLMMISQLKLLNGIYMDLLEFGNDPCCAHLHSLERIASLTNNFDISTQVKVITAVHLAMYVIVVLSILYDKARD